MFLASGISDVGCKRVKNQDRLWIDLQAFIFIVADGMGGENCGGLAADLAVKSVATYLRGSKSAKNAPTFDAVSQRDHSSNHVLTALQLANRSIRDHAQQMPECVGMGSTIVAVWMNGRTATIGSVGDSRVYLYRGHKLSPLTKDDSVIAKMVDAGDITADEARVHPMRNLLTQAAGKVETLSPQVLQIQLSHADRLLLSSDGLHGVLTHDSILDIIDAGDDVESTVRKLVSEGRKLGAPDNLSCVLIEYLNEG